MARARKTLISVESTPYYHVVSRCVRRSFLCGVDPLTGNDYEHRRGLIENKLLTLTEAFSIDICAYAIMSNHYHLVLHINRSQAMNWDMKTIIERWHQLFSGSLFSQKYIKNEPLLEAELDQLQLQVEQWRERLMDISWFMRVLNEFIARSANAEDNCTGRFWEGRFYSQALLDDAALAACMAYVDLNPIRAGIAEQLENSDYTSIQQRIQSAKNTDAPNNTDQQPIKLYPFVGDYRNNMPDGLPFKLTDYLELVEETGQCMRDDKRGYIKPNTQSLLQRLGIKTINWTHLTRQFESSFKHFVGSSIQLKAICEHLQFKRVSGLSACKRYFSD